MEIKFPMNTPFKLEDVLSSMSVVCFLAADPPKTGMPDPVSEAAQRIRSYVATNSSSAVGKKMSSYLNRIAPPIIYDFATAGGFLYLALAKLPGVSVPTAKHGDLLIDALRQLTSATKDPFAQNSGPNYKKWVTYYGAYVSKVLEDLGLSMTDKLSLLIDKVRFALKSQFTVPSLAMSNDQVNKANTKMMWKDSESLQSPNVAFMNLRKEVVPVFLEKEDIIALHDQLTQKVMGVSRVSKPFKI